MLYINLKSCVLNKTLNKYRKRTFINKNFDHLITETKTKFIEILMNNCELIIKRQPPEFGLRIYQD